MHYPITHFTRTIQINVESGDPAHPSELTAHLEQAVRLPLLQCTWSATCLSNAVYAETYDGQEWFLVCGMHVDQHRCEDCLNGIALYEFDYDDAEGSGQVCGECWTQRGLADDLKRTIR